MLLKADAVWFAFDCAVLISGFVALFVTTLQSQASTPFCAGTLSDK